MRAYTDWWIEQLTDADEADNDAITYDPTYVPNWQAFLDHAAQMEADDWKQHDHTDYATLAAYYDELATGDSKS